MHRRAGRAAGALSVVAFAAFGQQTGPALAVGTVAETQPSTSVSGTPFGPYAAVEIADPTAADVTDTATSTATTAADLTDDATPTVSPAAPDGTGIPSTVLAAYRAAEAALAASNPSCRLPWNLVAGIGRVESGHASGGRVDGAGTTNGRILGPRLDGTTVATATIRDTDGGTLDGDAAFDRAVGPMQFIPGTWTLFAKDGNSDGVASPHNVFDAAVTAGTYLCAGGGDLSQPAAQRAALLRYNRSDAYGALVLRWAAAYGAGVAVLPDGTGTVPSTTPTPPAQVPTPANTTLDPAVVEALAAAAPPTVDGPSRVGVRRGPGRDDDGHHDAHDLVEHLDDRQLHDLGAGHHLDQHDDAHHADEHEHHDAHDDHDDVEHVDDQHHHVDDHDDDQLVGDQHRARRDRDRARRGRRHPVERVGGRDDQRRGAVLRRHLGR